MSFLILTCSECGGLLLAKTDQKSRTCPYCGARVAVEKAKRVAAARTAQEASMILRRLKNDAALKRRNG